MKAVEQLAAETTYLEMQKWVYKLLWEARRRWPLLDHEKSLRAAYYGYCKAYNTYDPKKARFSTYVAACVKNEILELIKQEVNQAEKAKRYVQDFDFELAPLPEKPEFNYTEWMQELSDDGKFVIRLVFEPPIDITVLMRQIGLRKKIVWRKAIRLFLKEANWTTRRIQKVFAEIRSKL